MVMADDHLIVRIMSYVGLLIWKWRVNPLLLRLCLTTLSPQRRRAYAKNRMTLRSSRCHALLPRIQWPLATLTHTPQYSYNARVYLLVVIVAKCELLTLLSFCLLSKTKNINVTPASKLRKLILPFFLRCLVTQKGLYPLFRVNKLFSVATQRHLMTTMFSSRYGHIPPNGVLRH